jgi:hypothetical protein
MIKIHPNKYFNLILNILLVNFSIIKTGIFDNIDKLYGSSSGTTAGAAPPAGGGEETAPEPGGLGGLGAPPPGGGEEGGAPPPGGEGTPPPGGEITPESRKDSNYNILLENDDMLMDDEIIDLSRAKNYLGEMEEQLNKLLND